MVRSGLTLPYRTLSLTDVRPVPVDGWNRLNPGDESSGVSLRDGDLLESWDALSALELRRIFRFQQDPGVCLGLVPGSTHYSLVITGATAGGLLQEVLFRQDFGSDLSELEVAVRPNSQRLSKDLRLASRLLVSSTGALDDLLAPNFSGARLWEDSFHFGSKEERADPDGNDRFRAVFHGSGFDCALFHVEVVPSPDLDIEEAVLIYLNADNPSFVASIERCEPVASALLWSGVIRRLIAVAVIFQDLISEGDTYPVGSMGANINRWLAQGFPAMSPTAIKDLATSEPSIFESMIESWCGYGRDAFMLSANS